MLKLRDLSIEEEILIIEKYKSGIKQKDIISEYKIGTRHLRKLKLKYNCEIKKRVYKTFFNEDYFEKIDTEDKAYFLGFIVADGNINKNYISIIQKETDILYEFKKYINFDGQIYTRKDKKISKITITSSKIKSDLKQLGIFPNKTYIIKYPNIPENLQNHFIRGVFDGDGCITLRTDKRNGEQRGQFNICSGSYDFISEYYNKLVKYCNLSGKNKIRCPNGTYYVIDWGGLSDVEKIYKFLYKDSTVFLKRKKETFDKVVSIINTKKKYRK